MVQCTASTEEKSQPLGRQSRLHRQTINELKPAPESQGIHGSASQKAELSSSDDGGNNSNLHNDDNTTSPPSFDYDDDDNNAQESASIMNTSMQSVVDTGNVADSDDDSNKEPPKDDQFVIKNALPSKNTPAPPDVNEEEEDLLWAGDDESDVESLDNMPPLGTVMHDHSDEIPFNNSSTLEDEDNSPENAESQNESDDFFHSLVTKHKLARTITI